MTMIVILALGFSQAIAGVAGLNLTAKHNAAMTVFVDGQEVANQSAYVSLQNIASGNRFIEVFKHTGYGWGNQHQLAFSGFVFLPDNIITTAKVKNGQFVVQSQIAMYAPPAPTSCGNTFTYNPPVCGTPPPPVVVCNICGMQNCNGGCNVQSTCSCGSPTCGGGCSTGFSQTTYYNNGYQVATCSSCGMQGCTGTCVNTNVYNNYNPYQGNGYNQPVACGTCGSPTCGGGCSTGGGFFYGPQAMDASQFSQLLNSVNNQWFSSGKLSVVNQALSGNHFTASQVKQLVQQFDFSNDKLAVAKNAYTKTVDTENYFTVFDALTYSSSINELNNYIASL